MLKVNKIPNIIPNEIDQKTQGRKDKVLCLVKVL